MNNWLWKWGPMIVAATISLLVMWFIVMDFIILYLLFGH